VEDNHTLAQDQSELNRAQLEENYDGEFSSFFGRSQAGTGDFFGDVVERRASRRDAFKSSLLLTAAAGSGGGAATAAAGVASGQTLRGATGLTFRGIDLDRTDQITLAPGYTYDRIISWGDPFMVTRDDPNGNAVLGTFNNCGGGTTPWRTVLTAEENFNQYFANRNGMGGTHPNQASHTRYGVPATFTEKGWEQIHDRFDVSREPNEPNRFGWIVEVDPYDPDSLPRKHTALGRLKHEAAAGTLAPNGKWVSYTGDDERFEYLYKFVSEKAHIPGNRAHNMTLLDSGTLYVAKLNDVGSGEWQP
jgi:secreted PhoX family phosphatase